MQRVRLPARWKKKMISCDSARPTAWVIFRRKFTAVHHYLLQSRPPFLSMFTKKRSVQVRGSKKEGKRWNAVCTTSFSLFCPPPPVILSLSPLPARFPTPDHPSRARCLGLSPSLSFARSERTSLARVPCRLAFHAALPSLLSSPLPAAAYRRRKS